MGINQHRWDDNIWLLLQAQPTLFFLVPTLLTMFATNPAVKKEYLESVKLFASGAAPASPKSIALLLEKFQLKADFQEGCLFSYQQSLHVLSLKNWSKGHVY